MPNDTQLKKRSVKISGHDTSITLENPFWVALRHIALEQDVSVNQLISEIDERERDGSLSGAIRVYILQHLQNKLAQQSL